MVFSWLLLVSHLIPADFSHAAPGGELPMPDLVVVKPGAKLPAGVEGPELPCVILEETVDGYRVDLSAFRGIQKVVVISRPDVERVRRGDSSLRSWMELEKSLEWPEHSREAAHYDHTLGRLRAFLEKFPESPNTVKAQQEKIRWEEELALVRRGEFRVRDRWFKPADLSETDRRAWTFWKELPGETVPAELEDWVKILGELRKHHPSRFYPAIQERAKRLVSVRRFQYPADLPKLDADWSVLEESTDPLWKAWQILGNLESRPFEPTAPADEVLNPLQEARGLWEDSEWVDTLLERYLVQVAGKVGEEMKGGDWEGASVKLEQWKKALGVFRDQSTFAADRKRWFETTAEEIENGRSLLDMEKALEKGEWTVVEVKIKELLGRHELGEGAIRRRVLEIQKLHEEWMVAQESARLGELIDTRKYEEVLNYARARRLEMEGDDAKWGVFQQQQADLLVEVAQSAFMDIQPWMAWRLVLEAWRTKPGNLKAQMAVTLGAAGGFLILLLCALPLLLLYAWVSKIIEQFYFARRLRVVKEEEERHSRRLREAVDQPPSASEEKSD
jgi:hypothetical protein